MCNSQLNERGIVIPTKSFIRDVIGGSFGKVEEDSFNATSQQHRRCCRRNFAAFKNVSLRAKWKQFAKKNEKIVYKKKFQSWEKIRREPVFLRFCFVFEKSNPRNSKKNVNSWLPWKKASKASSVLLQDGKSTSPKTVPVWGGPFSLNNLTNQAWVNHGKLEWVGQSRQLK